MRSITHKKTVIPARTFYTLSPEDVQEMIRRFCTNSNINVDNKKTELIYRPISGEEYCPHLSGFEIIVVDKEEE